MQTVIAHSLYVQRNNLIINNNAAMYEDHRIYGDI